MRCIHFKLHYFGHWLLDRLPIFFNYETFFLLFRSSDLTRNQMPKCEVLITIDRKIIFRALTKVANGNHKDMDFYKCKC